MHNADISVVIPTRNRAPWLPKCLAHLEQQTYPAGRFEVLLVDDGSTDDTPSVIDRYASGSPIRIRHFVQARQGYAAARNRAAREAAGGILLFLCDDELVSPRLLEQHRAAREVLGGGACIMGDICRHPQLPRDTFTRLLLEKPPARDRGRGPTHFLDWHTSNFSIPTETLLKHGGFGSAPGIHGVEVLEMAFRLEQAGVEPCYLDDARVYIWQPATFAAERCRQYQLGYGLHYLQHQTKATAIPEKFRLQPARLQKYMGALAIPYYVRACNRHEAENGMLLNRLHRRVLYHDRVTGYQDALNHRAPRPPAADGS